MELRHSLFDPAGIKLDSLFLVDKSLKDLIEKFGMPSKVVFLRRVRAVSYYIIKVSVNIKVGIFLNI